MEKNHYIKLYIAIGFAGLLSAVLAFAGEGTKIKSSDVKMVGDVCDYSKSSASLFGFQSLLLLSSAQIFITLLNLYSCCWEKYRNKGKFALLCFIFSWVTFGIAFYMLLVAASASNRQYHPGDLDYCYILKPGVFSGAAVLVLVTVALGISCHVLLSQSESSSPRRQHQNQETASVTAPQQFNDEENQNLELTSNPDNNQPGLSEPAPTTQVNQNFLPVGRNRDTLLQSLEPQENQNCSRESTSRR